MARRRKKELPWAPPMEPLWTVDEGAVEAADPAEQNRIGLDMALRALRGETVPRKRKYTTFAIGQTDARRFMGHVHRTHRDFTGWRYGCAIADDLSVVGVVVAGRASAKSYDKLKVIEITRVAVMPGAINACSVLMGQACRVARELGAERVITYTGDEQIGASLRAAGFVRVERTKGGRWGCEARPDAADTNPGPKWRYERQLRRTT